MKDLKERLNATGQKSDLCESPVSQKEQTELYMDSGLFTPGNTVYQITSFNGVVDLLNMYHLTKLTVVDNKIEYIDKNTIEDGSQKALNSISATFDLSLIFNDAKRLMPVDENFPVITLRFQSNLTVIFCLPRYCGHYIMSVEYDSNPIPISKRTLEKAKSYIGTDNVIIRCNTSAVALSESIFDVFGNEKCIVVNNPFWHASDDLNFASFDRSFLPLFSQMQNRIILLFDIEPNRDLLDLFSKTKNVILFTGLNEELLDPFRWGISSSDYLRRHLPILLKV